MARKPAIPNKRRSNKKTTAAKTTGTPAISHEYFTPGTEKPIKVKRTTPDREPAPGLTPVNKKSEAPASEIPDIQTKKDSASKSEFTVEEIRTMGVIKLHGIIQDRYPRWLDLCDICKRSQLQDEFIKRLNP
ncbi:MAG TPA: hypothetical protein ENH82_00375 [bacterium]|nr:hypothetical protein [bacterium]